MRMFGKDFWGIYNLAGCGQEPMNGLHLDLEEVNILRCRGTHWFGLGVPDEKWEKWVMR